MPSVETVKKLAETLTGWSRPSRMDLAAGPLVARRDLQLCALSFPHPRGARDRSRQRKGAVRRETRQNPDAQGWGYRHPARWNGPPEHFVQPGFSGGRSLPAIGHVR